MPVFRRLSSACRFAGVTLLELMLVMVIMGLLLGVASYALARPREVSRKATLHLMVGLLEEARVAAMGRHRPVMVGIASEAGSPAGYRVGLFELVELPNGELGKVEGRLLRRWQPWERGVVPLHGDVDGMINALDAPALILRESRRPELGTEMRAIVINANGGLVYPPGDASVVLRLGEGENESPSPNDTPCPESRILIGRAMARSHPLDR